MTRGCPVALSEDKRWGMAGVRWWQALKDDLGLSPVAE